MRQTKNITEKSTKNIAEDIILINGIKRESNAALAALMKKYQQAIFFKMLTSVKNEEDARDLTMEIFTKVYEKAGSYNEKTGAVSTWLFNIANNHLIDFYRKEKLNIIQSTNTINYNFLNEDGKDFDLVTNQFADACDIADKAIEREEKYALLMIVIEKRIKNEDIRAILKLRYIEELSYEEIAERVGQPLGTVKSSLFRARGTLKKLLRNKSEMFV